MKIIALLILLFTATDLFGISVTCHQAELESHHESDTKGLDSHHCDGLESESSKSSSHHSDNGCANCECHTGHIHVLLLDGLSEKFNMHPLSINQRFPLIALDKIQDYYFRINRPPIS